MFRFRIFAGPLLVGYSEVERGDPPMGTAGGRFSPTPAYLQIRALVVAALEGSQDHLALVVHTAEGQVLPTQGGIQIIDYSDELGPDGIEVHAMGIGYPLYEELFPDHVAAYRS